MPARTKSCKEKLTKTVHKLTREDIRDGLECRH